MEDDRSAATTQNTPRGRSPPAPPASSPVLLFDALPHAFVAVLAGLALSGAILSNVMEAMAHEDHREA